MSNVPQIKWNNTPREAALEGWFVRKCESMGGRAYKFTSPGRRSVPDRLVIFPGGCIGFVELKRQGGKPTPKQEVEIAYLRGMGFKVFVVDNKDDGVLALQEIASA